MGWLAERAGLLVGGFVVPMRRGRFCYSDCSECIIGREAGAGAPSA